jgi:hypothetical protein
MYDRAGYTWLSREIAARARLEMNGDTDAAIFLLEQAAKLQPASQEDLHRIETLLSDLR